MTFQQDVLDIVSPAGVTVTEVVTKTGRPRPSVRRTLNNLVKVGLLRKDGEHYLTLDRPNADNNSSDVTVVPKAPQASVSETVELGPIHEAVKVEESGVNAETGYPIHKDGIPYRGRVKPCPRCGATGIHVCCSQCLAVANGVEEIESLFGWLKGQNKKGVYRRSQPQCRSCRIASARKSTRKSRGV